MRPLWHRRSGEPGSLLHTAKHAGARRLGSTLVAMAIAGFLAWIAK